MAGVYLRSTGHACWPKQSVMSMQRHLGVFEKMTGGPQHVHGMHTQHLRHRVAT